MFCTFFRMLLLSARNLLQEVFIQKKGRFVVLKNFFNIFSLICCKFVFSDHYSLIWLGFKYKAKYNSGLLVEFDLEFIALYQATDR